MVENPQGKPQFALTPGLIDHAIIDYSTSEGAKKFKAAIEELSMKFDLQYQNLKLFLDMGYHSLLMNFYQKD